MFQERKKLQQSDRSIHNKSSKEKQSEFSSTAVEQKYGDYFFLLLPLFRDCIIHWNFIKIRWSCHKISYMLFISAFNPRPKQTCTREFSHEEKRERKNVFPNLFSFFADPCEWREQTQQRRLNRINNLFSLSCFHQPPGKLPVDSDILNPSQNNNNNKWTTSCSNLLQNSVNCNSSSSSSGSTTVNNNNNSSHVNNNHHNLKPSNHHISLNHHNMQSHHHALSSALSSPFSSLLGASGGAGYLLDPLGNLQKSAASNHLF